MHVLRGSVARTPVRCGLSSKLFIHLVCDGAWLSVAGSGQLDLAIVLDTSGSTRNDRFFAIQSFVADLIDVLEVAPTKTRVAALHFSNTTQVPGAYTLHVGGVAQWLAAFVA